MNSATLTPWILVVGLAVISFVTRGVFIMAEGRLRLPSWLERLLRFAPAAALMAIIIHDMARLDGMLNLTPGNPRLLAGIVAFVVAIYSRNIVLTIVAGMITLWTVRFLL